MWEKSGVRGYPQLFLNGEVVGGGNFDDLQNLSEQASRSYTLLIAARLSSSSL